MGHDQRFKELLRLFLQPFLEFFFPEIARQLDLSKPEFMDKELFEDPPEGAARIADVVARVRTREGDPELLLIHIEVQGERRKDIPARMFDYYTLLRRTYRVPVIPVVIYLRGGDGSLTQEEYRDGVLGIETLTFRFHGVALAHLDAEEHVRREEALLAGLAALMDRSRVSEPLELRLAMLTRIGKSVYDRYRKFLLTNLVEVYFELGDNDAERFRKALARPEFKEAKDMATSHVERIEEAARSEGVLQGKRETLVRLLTRKFGPLPPELETRVDTIASVEELDALLDRVLVAGSLDEMGLPH